jgi:hypothetical protein
MYGDIRSKRFHGRLNFTAEVRLQMQQSERFSFFHPKLFCGWNVSTANFEFSNL